MPDEIKGGARAGMTLPNSLLRELERLVEQPPIEEVLINHLGWSG